MRRVQIVVMETGKSQWKFIAHGARYNLDEAEEFKTNRHKNFPGDKFKFLPVPKD